MSTTSKPQDRLEALLTGLEDDVLRMDDRAALSPDEDGATTDIGELRLSMESAISSAMDRDRVSAGIVTRRTDGSKRQSGEGAGIAGTLGRHQASRKPTDWCAAGKDGVFGQARVYRRGDR